MKSIKIVLLFLIIVLVVAAGVGIYYVQNKAKTDSSENEFYVATLDGTEIEDNYFFIMSSKQTYSFTVKGDTSIQILPNISDDDNDFEFTHNGKRKQFFAETNLKSAFNVERDRNTLTVSLKDGCWCVKDILEKIYMGERVEVPVSYENTDALMFALIIKEKNGTLVRTIYFGLVKTIAGIVLNSSMMVF